MFSNFAKEVFANAIIYDVGVLECIQFNLKNAYCVYLC